MDAKVQDLGSHQLAGRLVRAVDKTGRNLPWGRKAEAGTGANLALERSVSSWPRPCFLVLAIPLLYPPSPGGSPEGPPGSPSPKPVLSSATWESPRTPSQASWKLCHQGAALLRGTQSGVRRGALATEAVLPGVGKWTDTEVGNPTRFAGRAGRGCRGGGGAGGSAGATLKPHNWCE